MKLVKIGKTLKTLLLSNQAVATVLTGKIFPLVAVEGTTFPFLVYRRSGYVPASMELAILSDKYETSVNVADAVLTGLHGSNSDIDEVKIIGTSEEFSDDVYIQKLIINIYLK